MFTEDDDMDGPRRYEFSGGAKAGKMSREPKVVAELARESQRANAHLCTKPKSSPPGSNARAKGIVLLFLCLTPAVSSFAQESLRTVLVRPEYAGFRPVPGSFLRLGPFGGTLTAGAGAGFNDNYFATRHGKVSDWYTFQDLNFDLSWVMSRLNRIDFTVGAALQEDFLSNGHNAVHLTVSPQSLLQFQFQVADFRFLLYDRLSYVNDPISDPTVSGTGNLNRFGNTAGITVDWLLYKATVEVGFLYTYSNGSTSGSTLSQASNPTAVSGERNDFRVPASLIFNLSPTVFYGVDVTASKSTAPGFSDANAINAGAFMRGRLTRLIDVDIHAGGYAIDAGRSVPSADWDLTVVVRDQINRDLQAYASFIRDITFGVGNQLSELNSFNFGASYNLTRNWTVSGQPFIDFGHTFGTGSVQPPVGFSQAFTVAGERFDQFGVQAQTDLKLSKRWLGRVNYRWVHRDSNLAGRSYVQNEVFFSINYAF
jgi:hypothetical protein